MISVMTPAHKRAERGARLAATLASAMPLAAVLSFAPDAIAAPGQIIALDVNGPSVNGGKVRRCEEVARKRGFVLDPRAPVRVTLQLNVGYNRLIIVSARRGQVSDTPRPGWGMEQLCEDAMQGAERALADEGQPPVVNARPAPPPQPPQYAAPPPPPPAAAYGGPPSVAFDVTGSDANQDKRERCMRVVQKRGLLVNPASPVRVNLILSGQNRLQINSQRRGEVYNQPKDRWGMDQLCEDAVKQASQVLAQEGSAPAPAPVARPAPRGFALGPIPPGADLHPAAKAAADRAVVAWQSAQFEGALNAFREAGRLQNDPQFLFDQAVCEQRLGRNTEALAHVQQFIDRVPQSPYRPYADQLFGELQSAIAPE